MDVTVFHSFYLHLPPSTSWCLCVNPPNFLRSHHRNTFFHRVPGLFPPMVIDIGRRCHLQGVSHNHHTSQICLHVIGFLPRLQNILSGDVEGIANGRRVDITIIDMVQAGNAPWPLSSHDATAGCTQQVEPVSHHLADQESASLVVRSHEKNVLVPRSCTSFDSRRMHCDLFLKQ